MVHPTVYLYISNRAGYERRPIKWPPSTPPPPFLFLLPTAPSSFSYPPTRFLFLLPTALSSFSHPPTHVPRPSFSHLQRHTYTHFFFLKTKDNFRTHKRLPPAIREQNYDS